ncbi:hypothetical protein [Synechocystis sp. PCC 6803]|uniref:hypothetical protein n=1 Tax=Synechocystis sp. PCC 6803 TaxID=1148 RepID=UPI001E62718C|nr:hypothetical protein [Synechocystis sp. PCC 6803]UOO13053.1 hypothetical protein MT986_07210 [Synechocystis sp. PCC 6803]
MGQLLGWLAGSVLKGIPKQIVLGIFLIVIVWLLHLFLLVVVNDGFNLTGTNPWFDSVLVLGGEVIAGSLFWIFTGILLSQLIHGTLGQYLKAITSFPATVVSFCQQSSQFKAPILWLGFSGALVFALLFGNLLVSLQILLFTLVALQESTHFLRLVLKLSWQDAQKLIRKGKSLHPLTSDQCQQLLSGMAVGFGLAALLLWLAPSLLRLFFIAAIAVTLWQFFSGKRSTTSALSLFIIFTAGSLTLGQMEPVWADDGGWAECGQSLQTWIQCGGTDQAILNSGLAGLAIWLGWILGGLQIPSASMASSGVISTTPGATTFPQDIEYTYPDGRHTTLVYDPEKGGYINILTGGLIDPNEINAWHQNNLSTHQQTEDWRRRNEYLETTGQDAQSQALQAIKADYEERQHLLNRISQMEKDIFEGKMGLGDLMNPGQPGDVMAQLSRLGEQIASGDPIDRQKLQALGKLYSDKISGRILTANQIPQPDIWFDSTVDAAMETTKQLATVRGEDGQFSWLRLAGRIGAAYLTGGASEAILIPTQAIISSKEYVAQGGDSIIEGSRRAMETAATSLYMGEILNRTIRAIKPIISGKLAHPPQQAPTKPTITPQRTPAKSIITPKQTPTKTATTPQRTPAKSTPPPQQTPTKTATTPQQTPAKSTPPPQQTPTKTATTPQQTNSTIPKYQIRQNVVNKILNETENLSPEQRLEIASNLKKANKITEAEYNAIKNKVKPQLEGRPVEGQGGHDDVAMTSMEELSRKEQINVCKYRPNGNHAEINFNEAGAWDKIGKKETLFTYPKNKSPNDIVAQDIVIYSAGDKILKPEQIAAMKNRILVDLQAGRLT